MLIVLTLALALMFGSGCAQPDWIQQTLVTADVTGTWSGNTTRGGAPTTSFEAQLDLVQQGAKVMGQFRLVGAGLGGSVGIRSGPIEGSVAGDVFTFRRPDGSLSGEMSVSGDEMSGNVNVGSSRLPMSFKRVDSSSLPSSR